MIYFIDLKFFFSDEILPAQEDPAKGHESCGEGYFDIAYQGVANDFCRWVGSCGCRGTCSWWSCALAGSNQQYSADGVYQENQFSGPYSQGETVSIIFLLFSFPPKD